MLGLAYPNNTPSYLWGLTHDTTIFDHTHGRPEKVLTLLFTLPTPSQFFCTAACCRLDKYEHIWSIMYASGGFPSAAGAGSEAIHGRVWSLPLCRRPGFLGPQMNVHSPFPVLPAQASDAIWSCTAFPLCCRRRLLQLYMVVYGPFRCAAVGF